MMEQLLNKRIPIFFSFGLIKEVFFRYQALGRSIGFWEATFFMSFVLIIAWCAIGVILLVLFIPLHYLAENAELLHAWIASWT
ncbi:MAG: hypothetical protein ACQ9MH_12555 [Nitrospinales bacterium]